MTIYFHEKDFKNRYITVCVFYKEEIYSIGISISSDTEKFNRKKGNEIAYGRALVRPQLQLNLPYSEIEKIVGSILKDFKRGLCSDMRKGIKNTTRVIRQQE